MFSACLVLLLPVNYFLVKYTFCIPELVSFTKVSFRMFLGDDEWPCMFVGDFVVLHDDGDFISPLLFSDNAVLADKIAGGWIEDCFVEVTIY